MNEDTIDYSALGDEELTALAQNNDLVASNELCSRYKNLVRMKVRPYYIIGADRDDMVQEGMIGLFKAIRDYKPQREASFRTFAELCIERQAITAINNARRQKHYPLNSYISLSQPLSENDPDRALISVLPTHVISNPEELFISRETVSGLIERMKSNLTPLEFKSLMFFMEGMSYQAIATKLNRSTKAIDNALQRVKRKVIKFINDDNKLE